MNPRLDGLQEFSFSGTICNPNLEQCYFPATNSSTVKELKALEPLGASYQIHYDQLSSECATVFVGNSGNLYLPTGPVYRGHMASEGIKSYTGLLIPTD